MTIFISYKNGQFEATNETPEEGYIHASPEEFLSDLADGVQNVAYDDNLSHLHDAINDGALLGAIQEDGHLPDLEFQERIEDLHDLLSNV